MVKNTLRAIIIAAIVYLWLPTGADDLFVIPFIIARIGLAMYAVISIIMVAYLYSSISGASLKEKLHSVQREFGGK